MSLLEVKNLNVVFSLDHRRKITAVNGVSLHVEPGESVGLVGESGCGKSTLSYALLGLVPIAGGLIRFNGSDVLAMKRAERSAFRSKAQIIFQDPHGSLNPRLSIGSALDEALRLHSKSSRKERNERVHELLVTVGLEPDYASRYPHEFSGGQRQRIGIARAMAVNPSLIIADEPVSALDVSVQVQILNLMKDIQESRNLSYLFIAHDLAVVRYMCSRILVMYLGRIVESAPAGELFSAPAHPYTEALIAAVPDVNKGLLARKNRGRRVLLQGESLSGSAPVSGCAFHPRCRYVRDVCRVESPPECVAGPNHMSRCHFAGNFK